MYFCPFFIHSKTSFLTMNRGIQSTQSSLRTQPSSEPKVKVLIPMYEPLKVEKCKKCKTIIAEPKELIRIVKGVD